MSHRIRPLLLGCYDAFTQPEFTFASYQTLRLLQSDLKPTTTNKQSCAHAQARSDIAIQDLLH
eukprot:746390-Hanusia_phi.AAC.1